LTEQRLLRTPAAATDLILPQQRGVVVTLLNHKVDGTAHRQVLLHSGEILENIRVLQTYNTIKHLIFCALKKLIKKTYGLKRRRPGGAAKLK